MEATCGMPVCQLRFTQCNHDRRSPMASMIQQTPVRRTLFIVGLRNFDQEFSGTRHNIGATVLHHLAKRMSARPWSSRGDADVAVLQEQVQLILPRTFMNLSGKPVAKFFPKREHAVQDLLVVQDELELKLGQVKIKVGGSARGHNGVKSIIDSLGGLNGFSRVLVGIDRPVSRDGKAVAAHVLQRFNRSEQEQLDLAMENACNVIEGVIRQKIAPPLPPPVKKPAAPGGGTNIEINKVLEHHDKK